MLAPNTHSHSHTSSPGDDLNSSGVKENGINVYDDWSWASVA
jgi:hypothetical protein